MTNKEGHVVDDLDEVEFIGNSLVVPIIFDRTEPPDQNRFDQREQYNKTETDTTRILANCSLERVYEKYDPDNVHEDFEAVEFLQDHEWESQELVNLETMEFEREGKTYIAEFDTSAIEEYQ